MSAPSKIEQLRDIRGRLPRVGVALTAMIAVIALLAFGPVMPRAGVWRFMVPPPASPAAKLQAWAGYLENPAEQSEPSTEPLTSASYTSGFDKAAAGLAPESVPTTKSQQTRDPRACPDGLNCSFRTASAVPSRRPPDNSVAAASAPPPPAASDVPPAVPDDLPPADVGTPAVSPPAPHPSGLAALTSELPSPHTLLRPFTFVANTFTGFIRKL